MNVFMSSFQGYSCSVYYGCEQPSLSSQEMLTDMLIPLVFSQDYRCKSWQLLEKLEILNLLKYFKYFLSESTLKEFKEH